MLRTDEDDVHGNMGSRINMLLQFLGAIFEAAKSFVQPADDRVD